MSFNKNFLDINPQDIIDLVSNRVVESQSLEYKKELWVSNDSGTREMLKDISSMANAYGGFLVVGVEEERATGEASGLVPVPDAGNQKDRILAICLASIHPRILGLDIKTIEYESGKEVLVIKVPESLQLHQVTHTGLHQFWKRHDRQKSVMSTDEIKDAILRNSHTTEGAEKLIAKRKASLSTSGHRMVLYAIPLKLQTELFSVGNTQIRDILREGQNERYGGWNFDFRYHTAKPSLNGVKIGDTGDIKTLEFYRNGYFEGIVHITSDSFITAKNLTIGDETKEYTTFRNGAIAEYTYSFVKKLKQMVDTIGYEGTYSIGLSLYNVEGIVLPESHHSATFSEGYNIWKDEHLEIEPLTYETIEPEIIARELLDRVWQAFGFEHEPYYLGNGFNFDNVNPVP